MAQQVYSVNTLGGYLSVPILSKEIRKAATPLYRFRQFVQVKEAWGKNKGETVLFDKVRTISVTSRGGQLTETSTVPRTNITIGQGTLTIAEYGNAIAYTAKLSTLGQLPITDAIRWALQEDMKDTLDRAAADQFMDSKVIYTCLTSTSGTLTTNGMAGGTASSNLNAYHVKQIVDWMVTHKIPRYDGENYIAICSRYMIRGLFDDSGWSDWMKYTTPEKAFSGEIGRFYGVRFVEDNNVLSNSVGSGSAYGEAVFFGREAVMEAVASMEEIRADTPKDFGRDLALGWFWTGGFKKIWDYAADGEERIVYVTSA